MSKSKAKGTWAETEVEKYLGCMFPVVRPAPEGGKDKGDLWVPEAIIEVKNQGTYDIPQWLRETHIERVNAGVRWSVLVAKPKGVGATRVDEWWAIETLGSWAAKHYELTRHA